MASKAGRSAGAKAEQDLPLPKRGRVLPSVGIPMRTDHIRDLKSITPRIHKLRLGSHRIGINKRLTLAGSSVASSSNVTFCDNEVWIKIAERENDDEAKIGNASLDFLDLHYPNVMRDG